MNLELLLTHADDHLPTLEEGLPLESALNPPRPAASDMPTHLWDPGGEPNELPAQRWGVVAPEGPAGDRLLALIAPLRELRQQGQGAPVRVYRAPPDMDAPTAARWKRHVLQDEAVAEANRPRYLLMLGDLDQLSLEMQQILGGDGFIGRLAFSRDADYQAYVEKVLRWEKNPSDAQARALFYTAHDGTRATSVGYQGLITPSIQSCRERQELGDFPAKEILELGDGENGSVDRLLEQAASREPSVLFSLSHGLGAPRQGWKSVDAQPCHPAIGIDAQPHMAEQPVRGAIEEMRGIRPERACGQKGRPHRSLVRPVRRKTALYGAGRRVVAGKMRRVHLKAFDAAGRCQCNDRMVMPRPAPPPRLPAVHPFAVLVIDAGLVDGGLVGQHARQRAEKRVRGEDTPCPEAGRGKVDRSACERRRGAARHDAVAQAGSSALSRR